MMIGSNQKSIISEKLRTGSQVFEIFAKLNFTLLGHIHKISGTLERHPRLPYCLTLSPRVAPKSDHLADRGCRLLLATSVITVFN